MTIRAAGLILSSALVLSATACSRQAAPDCKAANGNAACPSPKTAKPHILPNPPPVANSQAPSRAAGPALAPSLPKPYQLAHRAVRHRAYAETLQGYDQESRQMREADNDWRAIPRQEQRPPSGPVYESGPGGAMAGGCDEACRYHDWFRRYSDWYSSYGWYYRPGRAGVDAPANPPYGPAYSDNSPTNYRGISLPNQSERDRMDPWHGYNSRDGLENGY